MKHLYLLLPFFLFCTTPIFAKHIIGGVVTYECLGGGTYKFTMIVYRDCSDLTGAGFDFSPPVTIYQGDVEIETISGGFPEITDIEPVITDPCLILPDNLCVEEGIYEWEYTFADWPSADSYTISYQRCCRNATVTNIQTPGEIGATFTVEITPESQAVCNNSPVFNSFPPILICAGEPLIFDHSATDADGDQLIYEMCAPLTGGGQSGLGGGNPNACDGIVPNPACPPPYTPVSFINPPYNVLNPMAGNPAVTVNPVTGMLSGTPEIQGQFVVGVCVSEFRNGQLLSRISRDFQFNVANCEPQIEAVINENLTGSIYTITQCDDFNVFIENLSFQEEFIDLYYWEFEIDGQLETFTDWSPTIEFPAHGVYDGVLLLNPGSDCSDTAYVQVRIFPEVVAEFNFDYDTCVAGPVFFSDSTYFVGGAGEVVSWDWSFGDGLMDTFHSPTHIYEDADDYFVQLDIVDANGCEDTKIRPLSYKPVPALIVIAPNDVVSCPPAEVLFTNLSEPINDTYTINWSFGDGDSINAISPTHVYDSVGFFDVSLEIISPFGCQIDTVFESLIEIQSPPVADFSFDPAFATNIDPEVNFLDESQNAAAWEWFLNGNLVTHDQNPVMNFLDTGWQEITLIITHPEDCKDTIVQLIDVVPLVFFHMPNAFTPNEDTVNDFFLGNGLLPGITNFRMSVWDRWGSEVYSTNDPLEKWNGLLNNDGRLAEDGTYIYTVVFTGPRGTPHEYKGYATLIR
ncbi:MAG: gliding motility-associated-like protein [Paraglaciecola sp.]|jgi:gliding motility-associated-like protein